MGYDGGQFQACGKAEENKYVIRTRKHGGFTLIEVTLAIVIGIIMIAGATLIYQQAKRSAGNSKANEKVLAFQSLVEQYAAQNSGIYPTAVSDVNALWARQRPDDWNKSPWGGVLGSDFAPTDPTTGIGVITDVSGTTISTPIAPYSANTTTAVPANAVTTAPPLAPNTTIEASIVGGFVYDTVAADSTAAYADLQSGTTTVKDYAVYIMDDQGRGPNFVTGGKTN